MLADVRGDRRPGRPIRPGLPLRLSHRLATLQRPDGLPPGASVPHVLPAAIHQRQGARSGDRGLQRCDPTGRLTTSPLRRPRFRRRRRVHLLLGRPAGRDLPSAPQRNRSRDRARLAKRRRRRPGRRLGVQEPVLHRQSQGNAERAINTNRPIPTHPA
uniref:(northern house mosquito) hypothetical protein n=1 Tax=Culex pipiens TaxID=7175 RepID=A0A8D8A3S4_CULPI